MIEKVYGQKIELKSKNYFKMKIAKNLDGGELSIPLHVINGKKEGPVLGLFASVHGQEYYHNRTIRNIVSEIDPSKLTGTILAVPVANPLAFQHNTRCTPNPPEESVDFANLNRVFPGKRLTPLFGSMEPTDVSLTMKMAQVISEEVIEKCNYILDFHGHGRGGSLLKMLYSHEKSSAELARVFGLGILHDPITGTGGEFPSPLTPLTSYAAKLGIPGITPEIGGGGHSEEFEKDCELMGAKGIKNVMIHLGMIQGKLDLPKKQFYFRKAPHVRAKNAGYLVSNMNPRDVGIGKPTRQMKKGEALGTIYDPYTFEELEVLKAPADGMLYMAQVSGPIEAQAGGIALGDFDESKWIE
jgi:hypothetical protein